MVTVVRCTMEKEKVQISCHATFLIYLADKGAMASQHWAEMRRPAISAICGFWCHGSHLGVQLITSTEVRLYRLKIVTASNRTSQREIC